MPSVLAEVRVENFAKFLRKLYHICRKNESLQFDNLTVTCLREKETPSTAFRELQIVNAATNESRNVSQLQYMAWPDHGVPDDAHAFIHFTDEVRPAYRNLP